MIAFILYLIGCIIAFVHVHRYLRNEISFTRVQKLLIEFGITIFSWVIVVVYILSSVERDMDGRSR